MLAHDWSTSALGVPSSWPVPLQTVVGLMLGSNTPMFVAWGPEASLLYNDAYLDVLGVKHPASLGQPLPQVWQELWPEIEPLVHRTFAGEAIHFDNVPFTINRRGSSEQAWFTFSYSPIYDLQGCIAGLYCSLSETTEVILAQKRRQEELKRLHALFEQAPSFMALLWGPDHIYQMANAPYLRFVGQRELVGKSVREVFPELAGQGYLEMLDNVYRTGEPFIGQALTVTLQREQGGPLEERFIDFVFQPFKDADGTVKGVFIEGNDITDRKKTEDRLRESEQRAQTAALIAETERRRLNVLLEAVPVGISYADANGKLMLGNSENRRIWGEYPLSQKVDDYAEWKGWWADGSDRHGQLIQPHEWALARALRGETVMRDLAEIEPFGGSGARRVIMLQAAPIRGDNGAIISAVVAQIDITDRIKAEAALRESEAKFRTIANAMPQMAWSTLPDGYHDYYNDQWYAFTGVPYGSTEGAGWNNMFHPDDQARAWSVWRHSLETGTAYEIEYRLRHHSGEYRWTLGRALPIRDDHGKIIRWMGTCTDIHDQKMAQEALRQAAQRKDEFLAMLAHELRNPLAPIAAAAEFLAMRPDADRVQEISAVISRHAEHMTALINDLMDVSRVTRGVVTLDKKPVNLRTIVLESVEQIRPAANEKKHALDCDLPDAETIVCGDKKRLVQVFANLLNNAVKYTPEGGHILLGMQVEAENAVVTVQDNGIGMPPELVAQAFELFVQGERTADRSQGGLGIGLAVVKSLIMLHGGTVTAHSMGVAGSGSTFRVVLPLLSTQQVRPSAASQTKKSPSATKPLRIVLVDDNVDAAKMLSFCLETAGHNVIVEHDAMQAFDAACRCKPDVCLVDIGLPEMDGNELARRLRSQHELRHTVLIAVTGYGQQHDKNISAQAGFTHHFVKPVDTQALLSLLDDVSDKIHD